MRHFRVAVFVICATLLWTASLKLPDVVAQDGAVGEAADDVVDATSEAVEGSMETLNRLLDRVTRTPESTLARLVLIVGGVVLLFAGWLLYEYIILIAGFVVGAFIMVSLVPADNTFIPFAAILIGGLLGIALGAFLYYLSVFVLGAYVGVALTNNLAAALSLIPITVIPLVIGGLVGGLVLLGLAFEFLIVVASVAGAQMLAQSLGLVAPWTIILTVLGVLVQIALARAFHQDIRRTPRRVHILRRATD